MPQLLWLRGLIVTIWFFVHTLICAVTMVVGVWFLPKRKFADLVIGPLWAEPVLRFSGIDVEVRGRENWPEGKGFLVLFNHTSWIDILVMAARLPSIPRFGAKIELFSIPFFGAAMRKAGMLPIERNNRNKVLQVYKEAEQRAAEGESFALAPEGTRQTELQLGRFKQGPFLFAVGAQMPILPLVIAGAREAMPKTSFLINAGAWRRRVIVTILPPVATLGKNDSDIPALQELVRSQMVPVYDQLNHELGLSGLRAEMHLDSSPCS